MFKGLKDKLNTGFTGGKALAEKPNEYEETVWGAIYFFSLLSVLISATFLRGTFEIWTVLLFLMGSVFAHSMKEQSRLRSIEVQIEKLDDDLFEYFSEKLEEE